MTVAVAHQDSATSRTALRQAVEEARHRRTDLAVLHVTGSLDEDRREAYHAGISDLIEAAVGPDCGVDWTLHLSASGGDLADELLRLVGEVGADLVVIGARRRSPVGKALMGSVAQRIILDADVPVLVVKAAKGATGA